MLMTPTATQKFNLKKFLKRIQLEILKNDHTPVLKKNDIQDPEKDYTRDSKQSSHSGFFLVSLRLINIRLLKVSF